MITKLQMGNHAIATQKLMMENPIIIWAILLLVKIRRGPRKSMRNMQVTRSWAGKRSMPS